MKKLMHLLKSKSGNSAMLDGLSKMLVAMMILAFALTLFPVFLTYSNQGETARQLSRYIERCGEGGMSALSELNRLKAGTNLQSELEIKDVTYIGSSDKIQLDSPFTVVLSCEKEIGIGGFLKIPISIKNTVKGRSGYYWKS